MAETPAQIDANRDGGSPPWRPGSLASGVFLLFALAVIQRAVGFLRSVLFCRWLDADQLGLWDMAYGFLVLAAPAVVLGLPGSFGRYVEYFQRRGQLRMFLARVTAATLVLGVCGVLLVAWGRGVVARLAFNDPRQADLVLWLAAGLGVLILFHFLVSLFTALCQYRIVSGMHLANSLLFAAASLGFIIFWQHTARAVIVGFTLAAGVTTCVASAWLVRFWRHIPPPAAALTEWSLWQKLVPFAAWLWLTNWLSNLFEIADRFMIVHVSRLPSAEALGVVGQYHSARIVPLLLVGLAEMLAAIITPHLAGDWEAGKIDRVGRRLRLVTKLFGLGALAAAAGTMIAAGLLFGVFFQGRYAGGEAVLSWALACSIWTGLAALGNNYLWCAERSPAVAGVLAAGLASNVLLNWLLLPPLGLLGAVLATSASRLFALGLLWLLSCRYGMGFDRGLALLAALPLLLPLGPAITLTVAAATAVGILPGATLFNRWEDEEIRQAIRGYYRRARSLLGLAPAKTDAA